MAFSLSGYLSNLRVTLSEFFRMSIIADFLHLIPDVARIIWFRFFDPNYNMKEFMNFPKISIFEGINYFAPAENKTLLLAIQQLDIFSVVEVLFCLAVCFQLVVSYGATFANAFKVVFTSYFLLLTIVAVFIAYLLVMLSVR